MPNIAAFFQRHKKVALSFSAGKDSAACLWLLQPWWGQLTVVWCDGGNPREEALEYMLRIAKLVPHFNFIRGDQPGWTAKHGMPVDVLPFELSYLGKLSSGNPGPLLCLSSDCCKANLWEPLHKFLQMEGFTGVIRGQRITDKLKSPISSGTIVSGVEYFHPIDTWTDADVYTYLGDRIPENYKRGLRSSLDCRNCTAYMEEHKGLADDLEASGDMESAAQIRYIHKALKAELLKIQAYLPI